MRDLPDTFALAGRPFEVAFPESERDPLDLAGALDRTLFDRFADFRFGGVLAIAIFFAVGIVVGVFWTLNIVYRHPPAMPGSENTQCDYVDRYHCYC